MYLSKIRLIAYLEDISGLTFLDRVNRFLPLLYLAWSLPVLWIVAVVTPPWQNPDEPAHMNRIAQIADGQLLGHRFGSEAGGVTDVTIMQSVAPLNTVIAHGDRRVSLKTMTKAGQVRWGAQARDCVPQYRHVSTCPLLAGGHRGSGRQMAWSQCRSYPHCRAYPRRICECLYRCSRSVSCAQHTRDDWCPARVADDHCLVCSGHAGWADDRPVVRRGRLG